MDKQQVPTVEHREPCSMLCGSLNRRRVWGRMDTCVCMAETLCCSPQTLTTLLISYTSIQASQVALVKNLPASSGDIKDMGSSPRLGKCHGGGHDNPLQYSCLENPMDRRAWRASVHRVVKSQTRLKQLSRAHTHTPIKSTKFKKKAVTSFPLFFSSVQSLSQVQLFATPWTAACQASLSITNSQSSLKLMSIELMMPFNHLILHRPLLLLPSIFPSIRVFSNESALHIRGPKCWSFSFNISHSNEHPGLISFRMDWLDLLAVQGTLKQKMNG